MSESRASSTGIGTSYIVRIYRRAPAEEPQRRSHDAVELVGIVEDPQAGKRSGFHNIEELWAVLRAALSTAPLPRQINPTSRASGKPSPGSWLRGCGYNA